MEKRQFIAAILSLCIALVSLSQTGQAQTPPSLIWQKALGGTGSDIATAIVASGDGGFVVAGYTESNDGDVTGNHGVADYWIVKLDASGNKVWQKALGGGSYDYANAIVASGDGGFVVAGYTESHEGDVTGSHGNSEYWVVKLDASGNKVWQKALGGSSYDYANAIVASGDGGFVVAGRTGSNDGNVTGHNGYIDYWVVKLNASGGIVWQKALGGTGSDIATAIVASGDGGFVVAGYTDSINGDVTGNHGAYEYWVVKLDGDGNKVWQKALGGSSYEYANAIVASGDGGFVVAGRTESNDGNVTGNHGNADYWVVRLDASGNKVWQKSLGGTGFDIATAIVASGDGGFVVAGYTESNDGDVTGNHVAYEYWVVKLDGDGNKVWQKALGGSSYEYANAIVASGDGGFVVAGRTESNDGDVTGNHGNADYWVVMLNDATPTLSELSASPHPVCAGQTVQFTATVGNVTGSYDFTLTNGAGSTLAGTSTATAFSQSLTATGSGSQTYTLTVTAANGTASDDVTITVNPLPTPAITGLANAYCKDAAAVTLTATPSGGQFTIDGNSASQLNPVSLTAGSHTVRYTLTVNGCTAFTEQSVEIKALPTPAITGLSAAYCKDAAAVTLTATPSGGSFTIDNQPATQLDPASLTVGPHTVRYTVTVNGCTAFTEQSVEIKALPDASFMGLAGPYCKDAAAVTLTATPSGGQFTIDGNSATQLDPASLTVGPHTVRYTVTVNGCTAFAEQSVEINALPTPAITGLNAAYCKDAAAVTLTATPSGGQFTIDGNSATQLDPASLTVGPHTVRYTVTVNGCTAFTQQSVEIRALPTPAITGLNAAYCKDAAAVTLTATPSGGSFTIDGNSASQLNPASLSVGNHTVRYTVTVNGCMAFTQQSVEIRALPTPAITGLTNAYCKDAAAVTLTATPSGGQFTIDGNSASQLNPASLSVGSHAVRYTVTANGCTAFTEQSIIIKALPDASFTGLAGPYCADAAPVTLTPTTPEGTFTGPGVSGSTFTPANAGSSGTILYTVTVEGCTNTSQQSVSVHPPITLNTSPNTSVVYGYGSNCTTLTASSTGGTGALGLSWSTGASGSSVQVCPTQTTAYTMTATDAAGCSVSRQITVAVNDVRCGSGGVKMCLGGRESCVAPYLVPTYLRFGGTLGGCANGAARMSYEPPGSLELSLEAYPNPAQDAVTVRVLSPTAGQGTLTVLDMNGMTRQTRTEQLSEGLNEVELRLGGLPSGTYLIRCLDAYNRQGVVRISKQ